jgi:hypothetical protein
MERLIQAKIQFKKLTWLVLGLCFVLLYSCPVKKYLLLTFGKARAAQTEGCEFQKSLSSHCEKIVYLRRQSAKPIVVIANRALRPVKPAALTLLTAANFIKDFADCRVAIGRAVLARNGVIAGAPPRYLEMMRFRV